MTYVFIDGVMTEYESEAQARRVAEQAEEEGHRVSVEAS